MSDYELVEVFPFSSDDGAEELVAFHNEIGREKIWYRSDATVADYRAKNDEPGIVMRHFVTRNEADEIVGLLVVGVWDDGTNDHLVWAQMGVRKDARRQGIGRQFLRRCVAIAEENNCTVITADTINTIPAGGAFARSVGAEEGLREVTNMVAVSEIDRSMLDGWRTAAPGRAPGYEVLVIDGNYPEEFYEGVARLFVIGEEDMPFDDLDMEPMVTTAETIADRIKQLEGVVERTTAIARHVESGQLVGFSGIIRFVEDHETLNTSLTVVDRDHRGFALGKWIKSAVILRALEKYPKAIRLVTENAASNAPMLGINTAIGFKPEFEMVAYQATVDVVKAYLNR
jgi:GNAT superfamily N-acetyltransferase